MQIAEQDAGNGSQTEKRETADGRADRVRSRAERQQKKKPKPEAFYEALKKPGMSYICEVKKASPSKGLIASDFPYLDIAQRI